MRQPATGITQNLGNRNRKKDRTAVRFSSVLWIFSVHRTEPANTTSHSAVVDVKDRVTNNPFLWPRSASLTDFRALLRRGNNRPSPGPDGWEKWIIKSLSDDALNLVLDLHNYQVMNSRFPGDIKDMWLTMFHKRGVRTNLSNWRGLLLSNVLANSPMAWLNCSLIQYSSEKRGSGAVSGTPYVHIWT
jgi:hypothetical protein